MKGAGSDKPKITKVICGMGKEPRSFQLVYLFRERMARVIVSLYRS